MTLFGPLHLVLLAAIAAGAVALPWFCRRGAVNKHAARLAVGCALLLNELGWWAFRYSHEGVHLQNLPLQLCDLTVWLSVLACLTARPAIVEFAYLAGMTGAGMALLTPDVWSPWPTYPAIYFFAAHGGIVIARKTSGAPASARYWNAVPSGIATAVPGLSATIRSAPS